MMNDLRSYSRHWIKEFIEIYKSEICLWKAKHPDYNNHILRSKAYDKLINKLREVELNPDRSMVVRKINSLRSAFRRELRKKRTIKGYEPRLWYYDVLSFIADQKYSSSSRSKNATPNNNNNTKMYENDENNQSEELFDEHEPSQFDEDEMIGDQKLDVKQEIRILEINTIRNEDETPCLTQNLKDSSQQQLVVTSSIEPQKQLQQTSEISPQQSTVHIQMPKNDINVEKDPMKMISFYKSDCIPLMNSTIVKHEDEFEIIGINVAHKLRSMKPTQRIIAEKLISDVLFNGQLESLTVTSKLTN